MDQKDEIKSRLDVVEVIREYIQLKAVGVNFQARCPFHREKTPSFIVSPEKQIWRCFGCSRGGDVFTFIMEMEGLSFVEALRMLAPKAGVTLQWQNIQEVSKRNRLLDVMELVVKYYHKLLIEASEAKPALEYLRQRGLRDETIEDWQIGYSRDSWDNALNFLKDKGFSEQEIFLAGLSVKKEQGTSYYDRFRGRIMFPINNYNGNPVAFSARLMPEEKMGSPAVVPKYFGTKAGKYINSPQTQIYDKSKILFGLDKAKQFIREEDKVIIVEGQMDMISSYQAGIKNVVASSGTALSTEQVKLLKRYTDNFLFSFDVDTAGELATNKGGDVAREFVDKEQLTEAEDKFGRMRKYVDPTLSHNVNIKVIQVPGGKDPDECIRNNPEDWQQAINNAASIMDYYFNKTFHNLDLSDVANKKKAAAKLLKVIVNIGNTIEQDTWLRKLADTLEVNEQVLREAIAQRRTVRRPQQVDSTSQTSSSDNRISYIEMLTESLIAFIIKFPQHLEYVINQVRPEIFAKGIYGIFYKQLVIYYNKIAGDVRLFDYKHFKLWLQNNIEDEQELISLHELTDKLVLLADKDFYELNDNGVKLEMGKVINQLKRKYLTKRMLKIERQLSESERDGKSEEIQKLMEEFRIVADEVRQLD